MSSGKNNEPNKRKKGQKRTNKKAPAANGTATSNGFASPALERLRLEKVFLVQLDVLERQKQLLPRELIFECLARLSSILKGTGELLQKHHGDDARAILEEGLQEYESCLQEIIDEAE